MSTLHGTRKPGQRGSIKQRGKRWLVSLYVATDSAGKRKYRYQTAQTKTEAQKILTAWLAGKDRGISPMAPVRLTVTDYLSGWFDRSATRIRARTLRDYRDVAKRCILPDLGGTPLVHLNPFAVHELVTALLARGVGRRTVRMAHGILHAALEEALTDELIARNPAHGTKDVPSAAKGKPKSFTEAHVQALLTSLAGDSGLYALVFVAVSTGLRYSEFAGLTWADVDLDSARLVVRRSLQRDGSCEATKTEGSARTLVLSQGVVAALRAHKANQSAAILRGSVKNPEARVFLGDDDGSRLTHPQWYGRYKGILKRAGLPHVKPHALRATMATLALRNGDPVHVVQQRGGWSKPDVLLRMYADVLPDQAQGAADRLEATLLGSPKK